MTARRGLSENMMAHGRLSGPMRSPFAEHSISVASRFWRIQSLAQMRDTIVAWPRKHRSRRKPLPLT